MNDERQTAMLVSNWNDAMRRDLIAELKTAGIDAATMATSRERGLE